MNDWVLLNANGVNFWFEFLMGTKTGPLMYCNYMVLILNNG